MSKEYAGTKIMMLGNAALARGAYEAGVKVSAAYPGTPSTEISENLVKYKDEVYAEWSPNEKVAMEVAIGASISGVRAMASMKHVGVNVASDPLYTISYSGVNGGLVLVAADDPGIYSSQNEQDNQNPKIAVIAPAIHSFLRRRRVMYRFLPAVFILNLMPRRDKMFRKTPVHLVAKIIPI